MPPRTKKTAEQEPVTTPLPGDEYTPNVDGPPPVAPEGNTTRNPDSGPHIGPTQMRQMHALFRQHGLTTDQAVYDYLTTLLGREVTSRRSLTPTEAAEVILTLDSTPATPMAHQLTALRAPFPPEAIGKLPRSTCRDCSQSQRKRCDNHAWISRCGICGNSHSNAAIHLDFVGHADVTDRLLSVDPGWTWEPMGRDQFGLPMIDRDGNLWINLTVCGVTRPGVGDASNGKGAKELVGDAIRNAAMRFGVALELWAKGDRAWAHAEDDTPEPSPERPATTPRQETVTLTAEDWTTDPTALSMTATLIEDLERLAAEAGTDLAGVTAKWREKHGGVAVSNLQNLAPMTLAPLVDQIQDYLRGQQK